MTWESGGIAPRFLNQIKVFWNVTQCCQICTNVSEEHAASIFREQYQTTLRHISDDRDFDIQHCKNLKCRII